MNEEQGHQREKENPNCNGGVYCLKLKDKEHSTQFIHLNPVKFSFLSLSFSFSDLIFLFSHC
jgi:hypothetical protein